MIRDTPQIVLFNVRQLQKGRFELLKSLDSHLGKLHAIFQRSQRWSTELPFLGRKENNTSFFPLLTHSQCVLELLTADHFDFINNNKNFFDKKTDLFLNAQHN